MEAPQLERPLLRAADPIEKASWIPGLGGAIGVIHNLMKSQGPTN